MRLRSEGREAPICVAPLNAPPLPAAQTAIFPCLATAKNGRSWRQSLAQCSLSKRVDAPALAIGISIVTMSMYSTRVTFDFVFRPARERNARIGFAPCQI